MARSELHRSLGLGDAVAIGVASMVGAGVFAVFAPAASVAGGALLFGLVIAGFVAVANATSSAQLAVQYPSAGGTYLYGRERLGAWPGFLAGWGFVIGKTASCAAMAMTLAAYLVPGSWQRPVATLAIWVLVAINVLGVTRTASAAKVLVSLALIGIAIALILGWTSGGVAEGPLLSMPDGALGWYGLLQSAGLLFFAFAGYARIATMGEEVRDPGRTIPRAIVSALSFTLVLYLVIGVSLLAILGPERLASSTAPVVALVGERPWAQVLIAVAAAAACAGALLGLLSGIGRTGLAMARNADLPTWFDHTGVRHRTPHRIEVFIGVVLTAIVWVADLRGAIGFSSFGVLLYYFIANLAAWTQSGEDRRYPRWLQVAGALLCVVLVATLPWRSVVGGLAVLTVGIAYRMAVQSRVAGRSSSTQ